jgi:hypothetical protein
MSGLSDRINKFINKQVHINSEEEAAQYGIKLPPREEGPKWVEGDKKPQHATIGEKPQGNKEVPEQKRMYANQVAKIPKESKPKKRSSIIPRTRFAPTKASAAEEIAHQLTPKPGYHSIEDITSDAREARRIALKLRGKSPEPEKEG